MSNTLTTNKDNKGREYLVNYFGNMGDKVEACLTLNGVVYVLSVVPKLVLRRGESAFGEQIFFDFRIDEVKHEYKTSTQFQGFELYLPKDEGLSFVREWLKYIEDDKDGIHIK